MNLDTIKKFTDALRRIYEKDLAGALDIMLPYLEEHPYVLYSEDVKDIDENFRLMLHYKELGVEDNLRDSMYTGMLDKMKVIVRNIRADYRRRNVDFYKDAYSHSFERKYSFSEKSIRLQLEEFVSDVAMLQLEPEDKRDDMARQIYSEHYSFMQALFCHIVAGDLWTAEQAAAMADTLLSPTIDSADAQLIVSGIMLASMTNFDVNKFNVLVRVYAESQDEPLRQKALIGWALTLTDSTDVEAQRKVLLQVCGREDVVRDLLDLQKQMFFCMNAEKDNDIIQKEIMPTLVKNSDINASRLGLTNREDNLRDILDPGAEDKAMEEVEDKFQKMIEMQRGGADIYFGGFAHMKRFPFFYSLPNWFFPFNINHPDISKARDGLKNNKFLCNLMLTGPFCDSDKYSFALAIGSVLDHLSPDMLEMMNNGTMPPEVAGGMEADSPAYIRRRALQDLYRFSRLYRWHDQIYDPFSKGNALFITNSLLDGTDVQRHLLDIGYFLMQRKEASALSELVVRLEKDTTAAASLFKGVYYMEFANDYAKAKECFQDAYGKEHENIRAIVGLAKSALYTDDLKLAKSLFWELCSIDAQNKSWALELAVACAKMEEYDEASKILFELDFKYPDSANVKRALAWTLMGQGKFEQADKIYNLLISRDGVGDMDYLNAGYCKWGMNDISGAASLFSQFYIKRMNGKIADGTAAYLEMSKSLDAEFANDSLLLQRFSISSVDKMLLKRIAYNKLEENLN